MCTLSTLASKISLAFLKKSLFRITRKNHTPSLEFSDDEFAQECLEYDEGIGDSPTRYFTNDDNVTQTSPLQYKRPIFSRSCSAPFGVPSSIHPGEGANLKFVHQNRKVPHIKITDFSALDLEVNSSKHSG